MISKEVGLLLTVVMLVLTFDCGNCNVQHIRNVVSFKSNAVTSVEDSESARHRDSRSVHRSQRSVLSSVDSQTAVDTHNNCRRLVGAADVEIMTWDDYLATLANDWANNCKWDHGQIYRDNTRPYANIGQNLYAISGTSFLNVTSAILDWYNERPDFNYETLGCQPGKQCGHYTQIVWATSHALGCAIANCTPLDLANSTMTSNALFLVCNYGPAGNVLGQKPYKIGTACSQCANGSWWCNNGLCKESCRAVGPSCVCNATCQNSGSLNRATCSCSCAPGWYGSGCSDECKDLDPLCNPKSGEYGYPPGYCSRSDYGPQTQKLCPKMCGKCQDACANNDPLCDPQPGQYGYPPSYCSRSDYGPQTQKLCPKMCNTCQSQLN